METNLHQTVKITTKKQISSALFVLECPICKKWVASSSERKYLPQYSICNGQEIKPLKINQSPNPKFVNVKFKVTKIEDLRKSNSSLELGKVYSGLLNTATNAVSWTDNVNEQEWVFWVGSTCIIIKDEA